MLTAKLLAKILNQDAQRTIVHILSDPGVRTAFSQRLEERRAMEAAEEAALAARRPQE